MTLDIKKIRSNPELLDASLRRRGAEGLSSDALLDLDRKRRGLTSEFETLQSRRNAIAKEIPQKKKEIGDVSALLAESEVVNSDIVRMSEELSAIELQLSEAMATLPNILLDDVPDGSSDLDNVEIGVWGGVKQMDFEAKEHDDLGCKLGILDFETAAKISGSRFSFIRGRGARLVRALSSFMLEYVSSAGHEEVEVPLLVRDTACFGTGQLPKFGEDLFKTTDGRYLIPTAEVSLTNMVTQSILSEEELPVRLTALSPCFRSEAGSAGRDTRGLIRQHQFYKVELVSITAPEKSIDEHERMLDLATGILRELALPYRVVSLCAGDVGFSAQKTYDIEVWLPGQGCYREISSISNTGDFQARRLGARYRPAGQRNTEYVHTLNGSALAVGRALVAVIENYQTRDGSVVIPDALVGFMGGLTEISGS